jgi:hypothetical protein
MSSNSASDGGAVAAYGNASVSVNDSSVEFNRVTGRGGGLRFGDNTRGKLTYLRLANNTAGPFGGGLAVMDDAKVFETVMCAMPSPLFTVKSDYENAHLLM